MWDCLFVIGGKWKLLILRYLANRQHLELNYTKILQDIGGISPKSSHQRIKRFGAKPINMPQTEQ